MGILRPHILGMERSHPSASSRPPIFRALRAGLLTSLGGRASRGVDRSRDVWYLPRGSAAQTHRPGSLCRSILRNAATVQPSGGRAIVAYRQEESTRLAKDMPILLEQASQSCDQDTWNALMEQAI